MAELKYLTRGDSAPHGKPRVYFAFHPSDLPLVKTVADEFFESQNCVVFYKDPVQVYEKEELSAFLSQINLFVVIVTETLLDSFSPVQEELEWAKAHKLPILPILRQGGLDAKYARPDRFENMQYLDVTSQELTTDPYAKKLRRYLSSVLVSDETAQGIRASFLRRIFLSYRKKDRIHAQRLMRLIHSSEDYEDVAIWYDEFLVPGRDFEHSIRDAMAESDLFVLTVTPNIVNEKNYVRDVEYKDACGLEKPVLPVEMVATNHTDLNTQYDRLPPCISPEELAVSKDALKALGGKGKMTPEYAYQIGLGYLAGIQLEVDYEKALRLLTAAADGAHQKAASRLASMYHTGEGVPLDHEKGAQWRKKSTYLLRQEYERSGGNRAQNDYLAELFRLGVEYYDLCDTENAEIIFKNVLRDAQAASPRHSSEYSAACYERLGKLSLQKGADSAAEDYFERFSKASAEAFSAPDAPLEEEEVRELLDPSNPKNKAITEVLKAFPAERLSDGAISIDEIAQKLENSTLNNNLRNRSISEEKLGDIALSGGSLSSAEHHYRNSLEISRQIMEHTDSPQSRTDYALGLNKLGNLYLRSGSTSRAYDRYSTAYSMLEQVDKEQQTLESRRNLGICYNKLGNVLFAEGDYVYAAQRYEAFRGCCAELLARDPTPRALSDLSAAHDNLSRTAAALYRLASAREDNGELDDAKRFFEICLGIWHTLAQRQDSTPDDRNNYAIGHHCLGRVAKAEGRYDDAIRYFHAYLDLTENSAAVRPHDIMVAQDFLGELYLERGDAASAERHYAKVLDIALTQTRNDVFIAYMHLGTAAFRSGELQKAQERYLKALDIALERKGLFGKTVVSRTNAARCCEKLSAVFLAQGDTRSAEKYQKLGKKYR